jgi:polysaccharide biosynthesis protein PelF
MHICLFCEGSYPYVVGGVSSWTHSLIGAMPEHEFSIVTLYPSIKDKGKFKYELHDNVIEVKECFLDVLGTEKGRYRRKYEVRDGDMDQFDALMTGRKVDWDALFRFFNRNRNRNAQDFLMSRLFYDSIIDTYSLVCPHAALSDFFWTVRSMILPLVGIMRLDMPKADIYHTVSAGYAGVMAAIGKQQHNSKMLLTEHGIYTREREEEIIGASWVPIHFKDVWIKYFQTLSLCAYKHTDLAITLFDNARVIQNEIGCSSEKQMVIENGVNVKGFLELETKELGVGELNIGAIVRVVPIKDILTMLQSFREVHQALPEAKFYIMGPNDESEEYYDECLSITKLLALEEVVEFTGRINIKDYLPKMDIIVLSSISEGQPLTILESLAAGIPNVATNVGSCKEILCGREGDDMGDAGIVVPIMDYKALAKAIVRIVTNKTLHDKMSVVGRKRVQALYTKERFINSYKKLYNQMIDTE